MTMDSGRDESDFHDDLLDGQHDGRRRRLLRQLDAAHSVVERGLISLPPEARHTLLSLSTRRARQSRSRRRLLLRGRGLHTSRLRWRLGVPVSIVAVLAVCASLAIAATTIFNLGKPTNSTSSNPYFPLSGFHKTGPFLRSHGVPELLWIGTAWPGDASSDWERWPVIKALQQFGTLSGIVAARPTCGKYRAIVGNGGNGYVYASPCSLATPDWTRAHYFSPYVVFRHRDVIDGRGRLFQMLDSVESGLFDRYVRQQPGNSAGAVGSSIFTYPSLGVPQHYFPLLSVDGYLQTVTQTSFSGDMAPPLSGSDTEGAGSGPGAKGLPATYYFRPLSFNAVRDALITGKAPSVPAYYNLAASTFPSLVSDVNGEANIITALICHADGKKPANVCGRVNGRFEIGEVTAWNMNWGMLGQASRTAG